MNADRRVPTAADVERLGLEWRCIDPSGTKRTVELRQGRYGSYMMARGLDGGEFIADDHRVTWLGPVNPEPLPWREGGR